MTVPVPQSHLLAVLVAIKDSIEECEKDLVQKFPSNDRLTQVFQHLQQLIVQQIMAAVQAVPLEEHTQRYLPYPSPVRRSFMKDIQDDDEDDDQQEEESDDTIQSMENTAPTNHNQSCKEEYLEDEDLLDEEALAQAKALRVKVRQAALRNQQLAQGYFQRMTNMIEEEEAEYSRQRKIFPPNSIPVSHPSSEGLKEKIESLRNHLTQLQTKLNELHVHLPTETERLQSTLDTVNTYLEKKKDGSIVEGDSDKDKMNHNIENAITSRDNEGHPRWKPVHGANVRNTLTPNATSTNHEGKPLWKEKSAEMRLALFLSNYP